jgi:hypothetical protein
LSDSQPYCVHCGHGDGAASKAAAAGTVLVGAQRVTDAGTRGDVQLTTLRYDPSMIDLENLRDEVAKKMRRKNTILRDIRVVVEKKLAAMVANNPQRTD